MGSLSVHFSSAIQNTVIRFYLPFEAPAKKRKHEQTPSSKGTFSTRLLLTMC